MYWSQVSYNIVTYKPDNIFLIFLTIFRYLFFLQVKKDIYQGRYENYNTTCRPLLSNVFLSLMYVLMIIMCSRVPYLEHSWDPIID